MPQKKKKKKHSKKNHNKKNNKDFEQKECKDLYQAIKQKNLTKFKHFINKKNVNEIVDGYAPIHKICNLNHEKAIEFINVIRGVKGVDLNIKTQNGDTALHLLVLKEKMQLFNYLVSKGASVLVQNEQGVNGFHSIIKDRNLGLIKFLVSHNIKSMQQDDFGHTVLHYAVLNFHKYFDQKSLDILNILSTDELMRIKNNAGNIPLIDLDAICYKIKKYNQEFAQNCPVINNIKPYRYSFEILDSLINYSIKHKLKLIKSCNGDINKVSELIKEYNIFDIIVECENGNNIIHEINKRTQKDKFYQEVMDQIKIYQEMIEQMKIYQEEQAKLPENNVINHNVLLVKDKNALEDNMDFFNNYSHFSVHKEGGVIVFSGDKSLNDLSENTEDC